MLNKKVAEILLDGAMVFGSMLLGAKLKDLSHEKQLLKLKMKIQESIIDGQQKIINKKFNSKEES